MPIIANAKKALRQSKTHATRNKVVRANVRTAIKKAEKQPEAGVLSQLFSTLDKAVKRHIIHKNKAARLKSHAVKHATQAATEPAQKAPVKKAAKKTAAKKPVKKVAKKSK